jgi:hypothetical protein
MKSGVYQILNIASGKVYIGSSVHIFRRLAYHIGCNYKDFGAMLNGKKEKIKGCRLPKDGDIYEGYGFFGAVPEEKLVV